MSVNDHKFEPLKQIDAFTDDMFNRIISFQEKEHPAWRPDLPFQQRIAGLPLHNLIFSNPDRDPAKFGPTIAAYYPLRSEIQTIAGYVEQASRTPALLDWYAGNGFIGSLIAHEGISVTGIRHDDVKPNQIESFFDQDHYKFATRAEAVRHTEAILVSWPPSDSNPSPEILALDPSLIVYIFTRHTDPNTGAHQTGSEAMIESVRLQKYRLVDSWNVIRPENILHEIWPDMTRSIEETRHVHVYAKAGSSITKIENLPPGKPYDWERDLMMASLALEAKQVLRTKGIRV